MTVIPTPRVPLAAMTEPMLNQELTKAVYRVVQGVQVQDKVLSAALVATHLHAGQKRYATDGVQEGPHIEHSLRNTLRLIRWGVINEQVLVASLLHDAVEDQLVKIVTNYPAGTAPTPAAGQFTTAQTEQMRKDVYAWIKAGFGERAAELVEWATCPVGKSYRDHIADRIEEAKQFRANNEERQMNMSRQAVTIEASYLLSNAGLLVAQHADMTHGVVLDRLGRFVPAISMVLEEVKESTGNVSHTSAAQELAPLLEDLKKLDAQVNP